MKRRILFVTPDLRYGGTNSSLSNIYSAIKEEYEIDVYALYNKQIGNYSFKDRVLKSGRLIYWCYSYYSDLKGFDKVGAFLTKLLIRLFLLFHIDIKTILQKKEVSMLSQQRNYDIVIGFQEGSATKFVSYFNDVKKVAWIHCDYARYYSLIERDELPLYEDFDKIVCVSKYTASSFVALYPSLTNKVISIYNLYDKDRVLLLSNESYNESRFDTSLFTILSVGRVDAVKRFAFIPIIAKQLVDAGKEFRWYIIGNVVNEEENYRLRKSIIDNHLENIVIVLGEKANPYPFFANSHLFVTTSSSEACPIVFLEAQTFNLPIVTTDFGSSYEFIENGVNGYIASLDNIQNCIIDVMEGRLHYKQKDFVNNMDIINQITTELAVLF